MSYLKSNEIEEPACEVEDLISNNMDLILLTGNYRDFFGKLFQANKNKNFNELISLIKKHFQDRIYFEIQRHNEQNEKNFENFILDSSKLFDIPLIASQDVYYLNPEMFEAHMLKMYREKHLLMMQID